MYRLAASGATVESSADYRHVAELREESTQLMRHEPQHAALIVLLLLWVLTGGWCRCSDAMNRSHETGEGRRSKESEILPQWMLKKRYKKLHGHRRCDWRQSWSGYRTHLI